MRVLPWADRSSRSAEPVEDLAGRMRATGAGARSLCAMTGCPAPRSMDTALDQLSNSWSPSPVLTSAPGQP
jgi:hypothetical protein